MHDRVNTYILFLPERVMSKKLLSIIVFHNKKPFTEKI